MISHEAGVIDGKEFSGQRIEFARSSGIFAAQGSSFKGCRIVLKPKGLPSRRDGCKFFFSRSSFIDCVFEISGRVDQLDLTYDVKLKDCQFVGGQIDGPVFGEDRLAQPIEGGSIACLGCDFTQTDLRNARFYQVPGRELKLPRWPHVTVVARDGDAVYAPPSGDSTALTELFDAVVAFNWQELRFRRAVEAMVSGVGILRGQVETQVVHIDDVLPQDADYSMQLRVDLDRFAHPAIRY